ncbi:RDD family protein [Paucibacter sp. Y2R2-4]|uniref:RDD family protein n=1 Tax=Paucibacter sp. Y2R2-4 TaxID=2893553 RepID=UPI0021E4B509|nr:RDD family protein [Paucibacter sp. Y2R2-4]MCV2348775.1 RDD family protein [Paucibacter sp. Y2R2-4]
MDSLTPTLAVAQNTAPSAVGFAGFWRRVGAFAIDCLILGCIGIALGSLLTEQLVALGPWGRLLGFFISLVYFGLLDSKLSGGQTPGKRLLKIRVQDAEGEALSVGRSLLRFMPLGLAWFPNNAQFSASMYAQPWVSLISMAVFGLGLSLLYLLVFNRPSRQSVHDLLVGAFVVNSVEAQPRATLVACAPKQRHLAACASLLALAGLAPVLLSPWSAGSPFAQLMQVQQALSAEPWLMTASLNQGESFSVSNSSVDSGQKNRHFLSITAFCKDKDIDNPERAQRLARLALDKHQGAKALDVIQVSLVHGYDIGIASAWRVRHFARPPADWMAPQ